MREPEARPDRRPDHAEGSPSKPMQRPGGRTERVRKQVIAATVAVLAEDGVSAVSVESVASRSGVEARGELAADAPDALIIEMAASPLHFRLFILWRTVGDAYLDQIVDRVLLAFSAAPEQRSSPRAL